MQTGVRPPSRESKGRFRLFSVWFEWIRCTVCRHNAGAYLYDECFFLSWPTRETTRFDSLAIFSDTAGGPWSSCGRSSSAAASSEIVGSGAASRPDVDDDGQLLLLVVVVGVVTERAIMTSRQPTFAADCAHAPARPATQHTTRVSASVSSQTWCVPILSSSFQVPSLFPLSLPIPKSKSCEEV